MNLRSFVLHYLRHGPAKLDDLCQEANEWGDCTRDQIMDAMLGLGIASGKR